jgi:hypothetical protein
LKANEWIQKVIAEANGRGGGKDSSGKIHHKQNSRILFSFTITTNTKHKYKTQIQNSAGITEF